MRKSPRAELVVQIDKSAQRMSVSVDDGMVRLHPAHAATLFALVQRNGPPSATVEISN